MFRKAFRLPFTLLGIPVLLDITFLFILPIMAWIIGTQIIQQTAITGLPLRYGAITGAWLPYVLGLICAIGLFISVLIHELGHSIIARLYGVEVRSITLWLLGGMAQFDDMPRQRGAEAVVAIAGPITSAIIGFVLLFASGFILQAPATHFVLRYLGSLNLVLAVFNLLPAMPLDGGRVLRSLLAMAMPRVRATEISATISRGLAIMMGLAGLFVPGGLWLLLIAFFIYMAVNSETQQSYYDEMLRGISVRDLMTREVKTVRPDMTVEEVTTQIMHEHHRSFPVVNGHVMGMVTIGNLQGVPPGTHVEQIMSKEVPTIAESASANEAMKRMGGDDVGRLVVTNAAGEMVGILSRTDLLRAIQLRMAGAAGFAPEPPRPPSVGPRVDVHEPIVGSGRWGSGQ